MRCYGRASAWCRSPRAALTRCSFAATALCTLAGVTMVRLAPVWVGGLTLAGGQLGLLTKKCITEVCLLG